MKVQGRGSFHPTLSRPGGMQLESGSADKVRNGLGSWTFVVLALLFLCAWTLYNGTEGFDPFPYHFA